jgi:PTS system galactitol-specific IIC component
MEALQPVIDAVEFTIGLGAAVFLPIVIFIFCLIVRLKPSKALRAAITIGVAFTGMSLVIGGLFYAQVAPAATAVVENLGLELDMVDIGWTPAAAIAFAWPWAALFILIQIGVNLVLLALGWTKTINIDMWNVWVKAYLGALTVGMTGSFPLAVVFAIAMVIYELKMADWTAYMVQEYVGVPGISVTHSTVFGLLVSTPINALLDRIPGIGKLKADPKAMRDRFGVFGESMIIGLIIGLAFGLLASYSFAQILTLGIASATALVLLPMIAKLFMEALAPISEATAEFMKKRFPGREIFIGLDWPILAGNPATYAVGILAIPLVIALTVVLPGNRTLVFGSIADWAWMVSIIGVLAGGNMIRMLIISAIVAIPAYLYTATFVGPTVTKVAQEVAFEMPEGATLVTWFGSSPINLFLLKIAQFNLESVVWVLALGGLTYFAWKYLTKQNELARERVMKKFGGK